MSEYIICDETADEQEYIEAKNDVEAMQKALELFGISIIKMSE